MLTERDTTDLAAVELDVRRYISTSFLDETQAAHLDGDSDLFALLDSLQVLRLVVALETAFGFKVTDGELAPENLSTIARIARFIAGKREAHAV